MEVGDGLSRPENRSRFALLLSLLRAQADVEIIPASSELMRTIYGATDDNKRDAGAI